MDNFNRGIIIPKKILPKVPWKTLISDFQDTERSIFDYQKLDIVVCKNQENNKNLNVFYGL